MIDLSQDEAFWLQNKGKKGDLFYWQLCSNCISLRSFFLTNFLKKYFRQCSAKQFIKVIISKS